MNIILPVIVLDGQGPIAGYSMADRTDSILIGLHTDVASYSSGDEPSRHLWQVN